MGTWVSQCHWPRLLLLYMCKEIQLVRSEEDQPWDFFGGNDAEAETPVLWPPHAKNWLIGKDSDAGRDWGQEEKGTTEDEDGWMASLTRWIWVWVNSGSWWWTGGLACCDSWGRKESDTTARLNWTDVVNKVTLLPTCLPLWIFPSSLILGAQPPWCRCTLYRNTLAQTLLPTFSFLQSMWGILSITYLSIYLVIMSTRFAHSNLTWLCPWIMCLWSAPAALSGSIFPFALGTEILDRQGNKSLCIWIIFTHSKKHALVSLPCVRHCSGHLRYICEQYRERSLWGWSWGEES